MTFIICPKFQSFSFNSLYTMVLIRFQLIKKRKKEDWKQKTLHETKCNVIRYEILNIIIQETNDTLKTTEGTCRKLEVCNLGQWTSSGSSLMNEWGLYKKGRDNKKARLCAVSYFPFCTVLILFYSTATTLLHHSWIPTAKRT